MSGLFRRARAYRTRIDLLGEAMSQDDFVLEIPDDERRNVLSNIDSMLKDDRFRPDEGALRFIPKKHSFVLPLTLNLGVFLFLGVAAFVLLNVFDRGTDEALGSGSALMSAEGRILENLRREAEAELGAKDQEIAGIRSMLQNLENQESLLAMETEARISEREEALRHEFEARLAAERARLAEDGITGTDLSAALVDSETRFRTQFESDLAEARSVAEAEHQKRIAEFDTQREELESQIATVDADRQRARDELIARNTEIEDLEARRTADAAQAGEASRQLNELRASKEQAQLISDQILAFYSRVGSFRNAGDSTGALSALDSLESYLAEDGIENSNVVQGRRNTDEFLITALRRLVNLENTAGGAAETVVQDEESVRILESLSEGALAGMRISAEGDSTGARQAWLDAFSAVPELEEAFQTAIDDAEQSGRSVGELAAVGLIGSAAATATELATARDEGLNEGLSRGRAEGSGLTEAELLAAREEGFASGRSAGLDEAAEIVSDLRTQLTALKERIESLTSRYVSALTGARGNTRENHNQLVDLLQDKLRVKSGLDESLHDSLDEYTDSVGDYRELEGREAVYLEIVDFLSALSSSLD